VAVRALEISATGFGVGGNIPTATTFIGHKGELVVVGDVADKGGVGIDGAETVRDGEGGSP
jgi:hypothetical protein